MALIGFLGIWIALPYSVHKKYGDCKINCRKIETESGTKKVCDYRPICKYAWTIPFSVLGLGFICYLGIIGLVTIQKSNCFTNLDLAKNFLLHRMFLALPPFCCCIMFYADHEFENKKFDTSEVTCCEILPGIYNGCTCGPLDESFYSEKIITNPVSYLLIPFTLLFTIIYIIGFILIIPLRILYGLGWCLWKTIKFIWNQLQDSDFSLHHCDLCGCVEIDATPANHEALDS